MTESHASSRFAAWVEGADSIFGWSGHLLIALREGMSVEKAVQFVKGRFSYRIKRELGFGGEVWQRGFSEVRAEGKENVERYRRYIAQNPVRAGLVKEGEEFAWCFETLRKVKTQGLKPASE